MTDSQLTTAINQLGAFLNDLASQEDRGNGRGPPEKITLPERRHRTAAMNAEGAIEQLALARAARIIK